MCKTIKKNIMKNKIYSFAVLFLSFILLGCFEDKGNYEYSKLIPPTWLIDTYSTNINTTCRSGGIAKFVASDKFVWPEELKNRENEVRYEWRLNGVLLSEELDFEMPTDELIEKIKMDKYNNNGIFGSFCIIEKSTDISYMARTYVVITPRYASWDWIAVSENGANTKCSIIQKKKKPGPGGKDVTYFDLDDNAFFNQSGMTIPGKALSLHIATARNVGPLGSATVITDQVAYEIECGTMNFFGELKDNFLDGTPADIEIVDRDDIDGSSDMGEGSNTFLTTKSGKVYTRKMSPNYLGGKFLTEAYIIDDKGYNITQFGHHSYSHPNIPCYDKLNNRIVMASNWRVDIHGPGGIGDIISVHKCRLVPVRAQSVGQGGFPAWDMPKGIEVLYLTQGEHIPWVISGTNTSYVVYYNDTQGVSQIGEFAMSNTDLIVTDNYFVKMRNIPFPGKHLDDKTLFLTSCASSSYAPKAKFRTLYTTGGNEIRYMQRSENYDDPKVTDNPFMTFESNVTFMTYDWYDCYTLVVGCENGDVFLYDVKTIQKPVLISKLNLGGKVVSIKELGNMPASKDYY